MQLALLPEKMTRGESSGEAGEKLFDTGATRKRSIRTNAWAAPQMLAESRGAGQRITLIRDTR